MNSHVLLKAHRLNPFSLTSLTHYSLLQRMLASAKARCESAGRSEKFARRIKLGNGGTRILLYLAFHIEIMEGWFCGQLAILTAPWLV